MVTYIICKSLDAASASVSSSAWAASSVSLDVDVGESDLFSHFRSTVGPQFENRERWVLPYSRLDAPFFRVQSRLRAVHRYHSSWRAYISPDRRESFDIRLAFSVLLRISSHRSQGPLHRPLSVSGREPNLGLGSKYSFASFFSLVRKSSQLIVKAIIVLVFFLIREGGLASLAWFLAAGGSFR